MSHIIFQKSVRKEKVHIQPDFLQQKLTETELKKTDGATKTNEIILQKLHETDYEMQHHNICLAEMCTNIRKNKNSWLYTKHSINSIRPQLHRINAHIVKEH